MRPRIILACSLAWLIVLWVLFLFFQYQGRIEIGLGLRYLLAFAGAAAVFLVGTGIGSAITGRRPDSAGDVVLQTAVGLAVLGIACLLLASLGLVRAYIFWILLVACAIVTRRNLWAAIHHIVQPKFPEHDPAVWGPFLAMALFAVGTGLVATLAPLTANDALVYHLNIPKIYSANQRLAPLPFNVYANMPHYGEMLYTMLFALAGEAGGKIFYFLTLMGAVGGTYVLATRFVDKGLALIAGALFLVHPLMLDHRIVCNVDVMLAYFFLSAATLLLDTVLKKRGSVGADGKGPPSAQTLNEGFLNQKRQDPRMNRCASGMRRTRAVQQPSRSAVSVGLLAGFMLGIKYTAILPCAALLLIPALNRSWTWRRTLLMIGIALLVFLPWPVKNEAYVGNPVYPLMEDTFDGLNWESTQSSRLISWQRGMGMGRSVLDYLMLPISISTMGKPGSNYTLFDGILSPVLLIMLPLALWNRKRSTTTILLMTAIGFVSWALTSQQLRFLIPTLGLAAVLAGAGLRNLRVWIGPRSFTVVVTLLLLIQISSFLVPDQYGIPILSGIYDRLPATTGLERPGDFLERNIQSYGLFSQMNKNIPPGEPVFLIWENRGYYLDRPYFSDSFFEASTVMRMVADSGTPADLKQKITAMGYRYVVVNELLGNFFSRAYPIRNAALLNDFVAEHLTPIHSLNRLTLYTIKD